MTTGWGLETDGPKPSSKALAALLFSNLHLPIKVESFRGGAARARSVQVSRGRGGHRGHSLHRDPGQTREIATSEGVIHWSREYQESASNAASITYLRPRNISTCNMRRGGVRLIIGVYARVGRYRLKNIFRG